MAVLVYLFKACAFYGAKNNNEIGIWQSSAHLLSRISKVMSRVRVSHPAVSGSIPIFFLIRCCRDLSTAALLRECGQCKSLKVDPTHVALVCGKLGIQKTKKWP